MTAQMTNSGKDLVERIGQCPPGDERCDATESKTE
jgi:hypothetical protein